MRTTSNEHRTFFKLSVTLARWRFHLWLFVLLSSLVSCTWLVIPGATGQAQSATVQSGLVAAELNTKSSYANGQEALLAGVIAKNGVLVFDTLETYEKSYPIIFNMNAGQAESWEKSLGFVSQRNIFNQIVKAEYEYLVAPYEGKSNAELKRMPPPRGHTNLYDKYLRLGLIRTQSDGAGDETYTSAIPIGGYLPIINEQGFFIVGNTAYQIKKNLVKEMVGVEFSKLPVLDKAAADDTRRKIKVNQVVENTPATSAKAATGAQAASSCNYPLSSGWISAGTNRRGSITVNFSKIYFNPYPYTKVTTNYNVNVKSQKKNFWGTWVYPSCPNEVWINLNWTAVFQYISKTTLGYAGATISPRSFSYPHPNCINDFNGSFNPISGTNAPYPSSFTFSAPPGLAFLDVGFQNSVWQASVPGGSSGINCSVGCP